MIKNMKIISLKFIILFFILTKCILANDINSVEIISDELEWNEKEKRHYYLSLPFFLVLMVCLASIFILSSNEKRQNPSFPPVSLPLPESS